MHQPPAPPTEPLPVSKPVEARPSSASSQAAAKAPANKPATAGAAAPQGSFAGAFVDAHNRYRAKHCAPPLAWSKKLADVAQKWANTLRDKGCIFGHSPGAKYGENLAAGTQGALDPESTVGMWYDEIRLYKFPGGGFSMETGHFTQIVWRSTREVGCGHVTCKGNDIYVCNYDPPGNWEGRYKQEVLPASCKK
jgi:pathogenesis-related protein 1